MLTTKRQPEPKEDRATKPRSEVLGNYSLHSTIIRYLDTKSVITGLLLVSRFMSDSTKTTYNKRTEGHFLNFKENYPVAAICAYPTSRHILELAGSFNVSPRLFLDELTNRRNKEDNDSANPFINLCKHGDAYDLFKRHPKTRDRYHSVKLLKAFFFVSGYDVNYVDNNGKTGLDWIFINCRLHCSIMPLRQINYALMAKELLAQPNLSEKSTTDALMNALTNTSIPVSKPPADHVSILDILETKKVDFNLANDSSRTSLHFVAIYRTKPANRLTHYTGIKVAIELIELFKQHDTSLDFTKKDLCRKKPEDYVVWDECSLLKIYLMLHSYLQESVSDAKGLTLHSQVPMSEMLNVLIAAIKDNVLSDKPIDYDALEKNYPQLMKNGRLNELYAALKENKFISLKSGKSLKASEDQQRCRIM